MLDQSYNTNKNTIVNIIKERLDQLRQELEPYTLTLNNLTNIEKFQYNKIFFSIFNGDNLSDGFLITGDTEKDMKILQAVGDKVCIQHGTDTSCVILVTDNDFKYSKIVYDLCEEKNIYAEYILNWAIYEFFFRALATRKTPIKEGR